MIRHQLVTPAGGAVGVASILWDLTAGVRHEYDALGIELWQSPGPKVLASGVEGLGHPEFETFGQESPRLPGLRRTGQRAKQRKCFLPLLFDEIGEEWAAVTRLFWRCVTPEAPVVWRVIAPDLRVRELEVTLDPESQSYRHDPSLISTIEPLALVADDPFWEGPAQSALQAVEYDPDLFFGTYGAPPFHIALSSMSGEHRFMVDGDLDAWPVLTAVGPIPIWRVSSLVDGSTVGGIPLLAGDRLTVDFAPTAQTAIRTRGGVDQNVTGQLTHAGFFRLVADHFGGMDVETYVSGAGHFELRYRPRYWRGI